MRQGARTVMRYFVPLYVAAIVVQVFLAGEGIFGINKGVELDDQKTLDAHKGLGFILTNPGAALLLILALIAWYDDKRLRWVSVALPFLLVLQGVLGGGSRWVGAFHPLLAFVILGMLGWLAHRLWRAPRTDMAG